MKGKQLYIHNYIGCVIKSKKMILIAQIHFYYIVAVYSDLHNFINLHILTLQTIYRL